MCVYVRVSVIKTLNQLNNKIKLKNSKNFVAKTRFLRSKVALNLVCLDKVFKPFFSSYIIVLKLTFSLFVYVIGINIQTYRCGIHRPLYFRAKPLAGINYHPRVANALKTAYFASSFFRGLCFRSPAPHRFFTFIFLLPFFFGARLVNGQRHHGC